MDDTRNVKSYGEYSLYEFMGIIDSYSYSRSILLRDKMEYGCVRIFRVTKWIDCSS